MFAPAPELAKWAIDTFISAESDLVNLDHSHLAMAKLLFVWSSVPFKSKGKEAVGTAQMGQQQGSLGKKELLEWTYRNWNGGVLPDFVITICAPYVEQSPPDAVCALIEHELYHCGQAKDEYGFPKFHKDSTPVFSMRGHDVEEFVGVAQRYGAYNASLMDMKEALSGVPAISKVRTTNAVCGCGARV